MAAGFRAAFSTWVAADVMASFSVRISRELAANSSNGNGDDYDNVLANQNTFHKWQTIRLTVYYGPLTWNDACMAVAILVRRSTRLNFSTAIF